MPRLSRSGAWGPWEGEGGRTINGGVIVGNYCFTRMGQSVAVSGGM